MVKRGSAQVVPQPEDTSVAVVEEQGKYTNQESLIAAAEAGGTKLLSARWLVNFNQTRGKDEPIKRQQDLPADAFVDPPDLRAKGITTWGDRDKYVILAVSYCWLTPNHPDPKGQQVDTLARALSLLLAACACVDIAMFLDFASLPQDPRGTPEEAAAFKSGLKDINIWYAHKLTRVFLLTSVPAGWPEVKAYAERGWPSFERRISSLVKDGLLCLDLGRFEGNETQYAEVRSRCKQGRCAPQAPDAFAEAVGRLHFTNGADIAFVQDKYRQTAMEVLADVGELEFTDLRWGDGEVQDLAQALPLAPRLKTLSLCSNDIGDEGAIALAAALPVCPSLQTLSLYGNNITDEGATALAAALPACSSLQELSLGANSIGDDGANALAGALPQCPALKTLQLNYNNVGDEGATALAGALPRCPALQALSLDRNNISPSGCEALRRAAQATRGRRAMELYLDHKPQAQGGCCALQ